MVHEGGSEDLPLSCPMDMEIYIVFEEHIPEVTLGLRIRKTIGCQITDLLPLSSLDVSIRQASQSASLIHIIESHCDIPFIDRSRAWFTVTIKPSQDESDSVARPLLDIYAMR